MRCAAQGKKRFQTEKPKILLRRTWSAFRVVFEGDMCAANDRKKLYHVNPCAPGALRPAASDPIGLSRGLGGGSEGR